MPPHRKVKGIVRAVPFPAYSIQWGNFAAIGGEQALFFYAVAIHYTPLKRNKAFKKEQNGKFLYAAHIIFSANLQHSRLRQKYFYHAPLLLQAP